MESTYMEYGSIKYKNTEKIFKYLNIETHNSPKYKKDHIERQKRKKKKITHTL